MVKKNAELRSLWFYPRSSQLCVSLLYYTPTKAVSGSTVAELHVEYADDNRRIRVKGLESSKVSVIWNIDFYMFFLNLHSGGWNQGPLDAAAT
jgi:hypothetical protein